MMALFSIANTVILKDASSEMHGRFRLEISQTSDELVKLVQELFPAFTHEQAYLFVECESSYTLTLYPASVEYKKEDAYRDFPGVWERNPGFCFTVCYVLESVVERVGKIKRRKKGGATMNFSKNYELEYDNSFMFWGFLWLVK